jgi:MarR family transcriptional regulator, transcriptional regulator for hemolysin
MAASRGIRELYDQRLAALDLNLSLASLLSYVGDYGPVNQTRLAEHLGQGRAVTGTQIDRLETQGLIERQPDAADRRVWLIAITKPGERLAATVADIDVVVRGELRVGIPRGDRQLLADLLLRLQRNISAATNNEPSNRLNQISEIPQ